MNSITVINRIHGRHLMVSLWSQIIHIIPSIKYTPPFVFFFRDQRLVLRDYFIYQNMRSSFSSDYSNYSNSQVRPMAHIWANDYWFANLNFWDFGVVTKPPKNGGIPNRHAHLKWERPWRMESTIPQSLRVFFWGICRLGKGRSIMWVWPPSSMAVGTFRSGSPVSQNMEYSWWCLLLPDRRIDGFWKAYILLANFFVEEMSKPELFECLQREDPLNF